MKKVLKIVVFIGILLIGIGGLAIYWTYYRPLPDYNETVKIPQLNRPVQIKWDHYGIPHIYAKNKHDLYMALGYVHAQDRLWQMTVSQMAARGRFAEFLGKDFLPVDKFQRTIGFRQIAKKIEQRLPDSTRLILQAYADGVNQYEKMHPKSLPIQFSLAGMKPIPWTVTNSLSLSRLIAWQLNVGWNTELIYNQLFDKLDSTQIKELFPNPHITYQKTDSTSKDSTLASVINPLLKHRQTYRRMMHSRGIQTGSNAWAVGGAKTSSGKPLLAGDPHLSLSIPGTWYEVHLNVKGKNLSGATIPGAPAVVLGQNDVLAWSFTNMMLDDTDFFEEKVDPQDSGKYLADSLNGKAVYKKFITQTEVIKIKNGDNEYFTRKLTKHGPVISAIYPDQNRLTNKVISMQWTGLKPGDETEALQIMGWAQNFKTFEKGVKMFKVPAQNVIYSDTAGNIALLSAASVPLRNGNPILLRPGWKPKMDWQGTVPYKSLPKIINPKKGWVANANNQVADSNFTHYLSVYWQPDSRIKRIKEYLSGNKRWTAAAFRNMQHDTYSTYAKSVTRLILSVLKNSADSTFATPVKYLKNWDFRYKKAETAASIMDVFILKLAKNTLSDEMGEDLYQNFIGYSAKPARIIHRMLQNGSPFFDDINTDKIESEADIIRKSMRQTILFLKRNYGNNPAGWQWQNLHTLTLRPPLFGEAAQKPSAPSALKLIVNNVFNKGPFPANGNSMTINRGEYFWNDPFEMKAGASIRRIVDLSNTRQSLSIMPGGQSENPLSNYYNNQTNKWLNGQYKYLVQDSSTFDDYKKMRLIPAK